MSTIFDQMLARYGDLPEGKLWNAKYEVTQQIALAGLHRGGFFNKAAFYGGTCLRLFHASTPERCTLWLSVHGKQESRVAIGTILNGILTIRRLSTITI